jgi:hypothetical protein
VFVTRFSWFGRYTGIDGGFAGLPVGVFELAIAIRGLILIWCVVGWIRSRPTHPTIAAPMEVGSVPAKATT